MQTQTKNEPTLLQRHLAYFAGLRKKHVPICHHKCPHCKRKVPSQTPEPGQVFDTMTTCPYCEKMYFKTVKANGHTTTKMPEEAAQEILDARS